MNKTNLLKKVILSNNSLLLVIALMHIVLSLLLSSEIGMLQVFQKYLFSTADANEYYRVAQAILGQTTEIHRQSFELRPFLFPLYLGVLLNIGVYFYLFCQLCLLAFSIFFILKTVLKICNKKFWLIPATLFTTTSASLLMAPYQAMTETLSVFLISVFIYNYTVYMQQKTRLNLSVGLLFVSLGVCVKGIFLPFFVFAVVFHLVRGELIKNRREFVQFSIILLPIIIQLLISYIYIGTPLISKAGTFNFSWRFFPLVYGIAEHNQFAHYNSAIAKTARLNYPQLYDQIAYVVSHPRATLDVIWNMWKLNYLRGAEWLYIPTKPVTINAIHKVFWNASIKINTALMWLHILLIPLMFVYGLIFRKQTLFSWILVLIVFQLSVFLLSVLVYFQGDRIVLVTLPVYVALYAFFASNLINKASKNRMLSIYS